MQCDHGLLLAISKEREKPVVAELTMKNYGKWEPDTGENVQVHEFVRRRAIKN